MVRAELKQPVVVEAIMPAQQPERLYKAFLEQEGIIQQQVPTPAQEDRVLAAVAADGLAEAQVGLLPVQVFKRAQVEEAQVISVV